ncbi:MAG: hypothetical protein JJ971_10605 [Balneolaceae bacterium]|nr:hypothetical protein [Balneolaceae bacterium]MBO6546304.1 hypothetical protein [Balneolaceae bacterium]MBO6648663.1 hypothetical protein [Balneolaceae bacterium]
MNISTKLEEEHFDPDKPSQGYEWWYFDTISLDKTWSLVVIFFQGNPFSPEYIKAGPEANPDQYPAISISIYKNGKPEYYSFLEYQEGRFHWDEEDGSCSIGSNFFKRSIRDGKVEYELLLAQTLDSNHSINAKLKFTSSILADDLIDHESEDEKHFWNLIQPHSQVNGSISIKGKSNDFNILFIGTGYHDHNTGYEPMKDSFKDWYWGRFHFSESTLIYYVMNSLDGSEQYKAWLISREGDKVLTSFDEVKLNYFTKNRLGLSSARKLELKSREVEATIQLNSIMDNGPFYQRFLSEAVMQYKGNTMVAKGISEYIKPDQIYEEKYWWMVRMRLRFLNQKPHWVQRSKMFYEWTW